MAFLGTGPPFVDPGVCPFGQHLLLWSASTLLDGAPPFSGVVPVGSGDGVGDCHDAANFPKNGPFISLEFFSGGRNYAFFYKGMVFMLCVLLGMLVGKWEPTPCYRDAYSVGIPKGA